MCRLYDHLDSLSNSQKVYPQISHLNSCGIPKKRGNKKNPLDKSNTFQNVQYFKLSEDQNVLLSSLDTSSTPKLTMKKTGQSCLSNLAAVPACCLVTVRLPQTRYFQYCPFVLPACHTGILPNSRKTSTKMSEIVLYANIIAHRFKQQQYCFV